MESGFDEEFIRTLDEDDAKRFLEESGVRDLQQKRLLREFGCMRARRAPADGDGAAAAAPPGGGGGDDEATTAAGHRRFIGAASPPFSLVGQAWSSWWADSVDTKIEADTTAIGAALVDGPSVVARCCELPRKPDDPPALPQWPTKIVVGADGARLPGPAGRIAKCLYILNEYGLAFHFVLYRACVVQGLTPLMDYRFERELGQGGFGAVCLVTHRHAAAKPFALKIMRPKPRANEDAAGALERATKEIRLQQQAAAGSEFIVRVHTWGQAGAAHLFMVTDFCPGGELQQYIERGAGVADEGTRWRWAHDIVSGLRDLHAKGITHLECVVAGRAPSRVVRRRGSCTARHRSYVHVLL